MSRSITFLQSIYANSVFTRTSYYMYPLFIKKVFFSVSMKTFIISERRNCMNKASSVTDSYLQNFFFLSKSFFTNDCPKRTFGVCDLLYCYMTGQNPLS